MGLMGKQKLCVKYDFFSNGECIPSIDNNILPFFGETALSYSKYVILAELSQDSHLALATEMDIVT